MDRDMDMLDMAKCLVSRDVATRANLRTVQIKGIQALVWWIHDLQTHNHPLIANKFVQVFKRPEMTEKRI